jgi:hypothetical protein
LSWKNKWLWIFGFFAGLLGNGMAYEVFFKNINYAGLVGWNFGSYFPPIYQKISPLASFRSWGLPWAIILASALFLFVSAAAIFLAVVSYGALVNGGKKLIKGKSNFKECFQAGIKNFWHILGYNAFGKILVYSCLFLASLPLGWYLGSGNRFALAVYFLTFLLALAVSLGVSFLIVYASAGRIILGENFWESIVNGLVTFKKHWLVTVEMTAVLFFLNITAALLLATGMIFASIPFFLLFLGAYLLNSTFAFWLVLALTLTVFSVFAIVVGSFVSAWTISAWTMLYLRIVDETAVSKLVRIGKSLPAYFKMK